MAHGYTSTEQIAAHTRQLVEQHNRLSQLVDDLTARVEALEAKPGPKTTSR